MTRKTLIATATAIFAAGSFLSACSQAALAAASPHASAGVERFVGLAYTLASIIILFAVAYWIECRKAHANAAVPAPQPARSRGWPVLSASSSP